jgi:hypothetical protein
MNDGKGARAAPLAVERVDARRYCTQFLIFLRRATNAMTPRPATISV